MISNLSESPFRIYQKPAALLTGTVPLTVELGHTILTSLQNRKRIHDIFTQEGQWFYKSFTHPSDSNGLKYAKITGIAIATLSIIGGLSSTIFLVLPPLYAIPVALTAIVTFGKVFHHRQEISSAFIKTKQFIVESYSRRENETEKQAALRIFKNSLITAVFVGTVSGAFILPQFFAAPILGIPIGLGLAAAVILAAIKKDTVIDAFKPRKGESQEDAIKRIIGNASLALLFAGFLTSLFISLPTLSSQLTNVLNGEIWGAGVGSSSLIFAEYTTVALAHFVLAAKSFVEGKKSKGIYHTVNGALTLATATHRFLFDEKFRLHHDFIGQLLQLVPLVPIQIIGATYTLDSFFYFIHPTRSNYDFSNILVDYPKVIFPTLTYSSAMKIWREIVSFKPKIDMIKSRRD